MELDLGLGLSNFGHKVHVLKELDLISFVNGGSKRVYDDDDHHHHDGHGDGDDESSLCSQNSVIYDDERDEKKRRRFSDAMFEGESLSYPVSVDDDDDDGGDDDDDDDDVCKTLPLLVWDDKKEPNEEGNHPKRVCQSNSFSIAKNEGDGIVGWPPVKSSYRKKLHHDNHQQCRRRRNFPAVDHGGGCGGLRSMYVKVQMEGCGITRKVDLQLYHSYESLMHCLLTMFGKGKDSEDEYNLTYQDKEGDWLLAGDLPWRTFIGSVQRLKMMKRKDQSQSE